MDSIFNALQTDVRNHVAYIEKEIRFICTQFPKRDPASEGERLCGEYLYKVLKEDCGCDELTKEEYSAHPRAFYGWIYFTNVLYMTAFALIPVLPVLSIVLLIIGYAICHLEFVLYKRPVDWIFPEKMGINVMGVKHAAGEAKNRIILNGHTDAAWEWTANYYLGNNGFYTQAVTPTVGACYYLLLSILSMIFPVFRGLSVFWYIGLIFIPFMIIMFFLCNYRIVVDGANDNLSGCYMGIALLKLMKEKGIRLEETEVAVLLTGSEEAGLRGAKQWAENHKNDYKDIPTYIISFDTIHDPKFLGVNYKDLNETVYSDKELADWLADTAGKCSIPMKKIKVPFGAGATDSAAFTQAGFRSVGITALNDTLEKYYHTRKDSWDNLGDEGMANCLLTTAKFIDRMESGEF